MAVDGFHPTGAHGKLLSVHFKSDLYIVGIRVTYITSFIAAFPDLKQTAMQVALELAYALRSDQTHLKFLSKALLHRIVKTSVCWR